MITFSHVYQLFFILSQWTFLSLHHISSKFSHFLQSYNLVEKSVSPTTYPVTGDKGNPYYSQELDAGEH